MRYALPILTCKEAAECEREFFAAGIFGEAEAIERAGSGIAKSFLSEFRLPQNPRIAVLCGAGHNGADALVAARQICAAIRGAKIYIAIPNREKLKQNTAHAFDELAAKFSSQIERIVPDAEIFELAGRFDLAIEGLTGMTFRPPARENLARAIESANALHARIKISVDIPAGASDGSPNSPVFRADATYATGIAKAALFEKFNREYAGRIRLVDIGFFEDRDWPSQRFIISESISGPLKELRPSISDKRSYGHAFVLAGSRQYPGAALMNVKAALRSGAGLVTAFVPETFAPQFAAAEPSAIWVGCPEDENGAIALESYGLIRSRIGKADALLAGSGITACAETAALVRQILSDFPELPAVLDADAITKQTMDALKGRLAPSIATPHEGEFLRIAKDASDSSLAEACEKYGCAILLKSSATRSCVDGRIIYSTRGGPVLSRGGSGDILAGLCCGIAASKKFPSPALAALCASDWLGRAAELAARELGETAVATSDIIKFLPSALL